MTFLKRGSLQLFRSLGLRDEYAMQRVQMVGHKAYVYYCEAYNDCTPEDWPKLFERRAVSAACHAFDRGEVGQGERQIVL